MTCAGQLIRCNAAVAWEAAKPLSIEESEVAPSQKNEVNMKILLASLRHSHTDVYFCTVMAFLSSFNWINSLLNSVPFSEINKAFQYMFRMDA
ncbi:hypothetical protein DITRI_Ditri05aG0108000 [Diplodiscus trichospermus]